VSVLPGQVPPEPEDSPIDESQAHESLNYEPLEVPPNELQPPEEWTDSIVEPHSEIDPLAPDSSTIQPAGPVIEPQLFDSYSIPQYIPVTRIPNFGHFSLLLVLLLLGLIGAASMLPIGLHFHLFGITNLHQASEDFRYALGSQAIQYFITFVGCLVVFPMVWHKGFFDGLHWHVKTALHYKGRLISAALLCFVGAMVNGLLMPGPKDAPIDRLFRSPGAAWVLFAFGVTLAPFFEELMFRGFLLPALCTAYDWLAEKMKGTPRLPLDENDNPQWTMPAMLIASVLTSIPFALMHGEQTSYSLGPFLLLICVSLVLCWARLSTRSLAASTMVHASYNLILFSFMLLGTGGFKHLDKM
jgi:uncharacterized protein